ncbi:KpsF/GutQ family sugar-phosphate isomerase [Tianweitania sediminis]|uniref:KpsF/GutQ family sugar-phosphate isomerase n=1 Tax=Tianweitania sediminis TaxID=1502156 RepID=A0A8J7QYW8_9HYPH|nr:KpsF/GutQ family sugar-phosphate isomerase [Tianweitania sediminis]MBP0439298.1 KpsF/GutQ family sugar-phosphate isomerase [Tianweitania sediminis]
MSNLATMRPPVGEATQSALRTVDCEQAGLAALQQSLQNGLAEPFSRAVDLIRSVSGRLILTGVGKSGHIGAKLAATFASTGTPAFFVHPVEANHGDLGMIATDDVILAMSWSGESAELKGIVNYARRFDIPLIAMTAGVQSALAREASVVLALPRVQEACPHGLAPTTSTVMQLVLGDALAVALLEARGFTADHFRTFHPGGKLGANLTHVRDLMHGGAMIPVAQRGTPLREAMLTLSQKRFGCVCVLEGDGRLAGIITDGDLARHIDRDLAALTVDEIMTPNPKSVSPDTLAGAAIGVLEELKISALVVVENERPVGIVHFHDLLRVGVA